jgi:hypothetical protein
MQYELPSSVADRKVGALGEAHTMTKRELEELLNKEGFRADSYDLDGGMLPERLTLAKEAGRWSVYYSERGLQTGKAFFDSESEACQNLLDQLRDEPSAREGLR